MIFLSFLLIAWKKIFRLRFIMFGHYKKLDEENPVYIGRNYHLQ
jgi:hypothetical protein